MQNTPRIVMLALLTACFVSALSGCTRQPNQDTHETTEILSDKDEARPTKGPVRLQERSSFPVDDKQRAYATLADSDDRVAAAAKPIKLGESKPR